jgi:hypothetical protein
MPQAEEPELYRVEPDRPNGPLRDEGIHSWPIGSFAPMGFYRPAPIVHFTGTVLFQFVLDFVLQAWFAAAPGILTVGACTVVAIVLGRRAYSRWLGAASSWWKVATFAALVLNLLFVSFITLAHGCGLDSLATGFEQAALTRTGAGEGCEPSTAELAAEYEELL